MDSAAFGRLFRRALDHHGSRRSLGLHQGLRLTPLDLETLRSPLIAAEQTGRKTYLMELDQLYCDVIVQRYERFTGLKAKRVTTL